VLNLMHCTGCSCEYLAPQPSDAWLSEEYSNYYSRRRASISRAKVPFFEGLLQDLGREFSNKRVIDVGAAEGDLIFALTRRWPSVHAVALEANPESRAFFQDLRCDYFNTDIVEWLEAGHQERFDYIFLFDLLEHVRDPMHVVQELARCHVRRGGIFVATFPAASLSSRKILRRFWPQYKVEHLFYFSSGAIQCIEEACGLRRVGLRPLTKRLPLDYLLTVGSEFGPDLTQWACRAARSIAPFRLGGIRVPLRLGEYLWIAEKS
jgi:SAM-dependent methyltransferase